MKRILIFVFAAFALAGPAASQSSWSTGANNHNWPVTPTSDPTDSNGMPLRVAAPVPYAAMQDCFDRRDVTSPACKAGCHYYSTSDHDVCASIDANGGKASHDTVEDCFGGAMIATDRSVHVDWECVDKLAAKWRPDLNNENAAIAYLLKAVREGKAK
jgi:hypothetical protein